MRILDAADPSSWQDAAVTLEQGSVVALPTDTVYGLAAVPSAAARLFEIKGRDRSVPIAVLVADLGQADRLVRLSEADRLLAARHWPGALTIVAEVRAELSFDVGGDGRSLGVRCPADDRLRSMLSSLGPLAVTSANRSGEPPRRDAGEIASLVGIDLMIDGGRLAGEASTVVRDGVVLRSGPVDPR